VNRALVVAGAGYDPRNRRRNDVLLDERDPERVREIAELLGVDLPVSASWVESPVVTVVLLHDRAPSFERGLLGGGRWMRTENGDAELPDPARLVALLGSATAQLLALQDDEPPALPSARHRRAPQ